MSVATADRIPLSEVRKNLRVRWYRSPIEREEVQRLVQRSDLRGAFQAVGHIGLWLCTGTLTFIAAHNGNWPLALLGLFLHGTVGTFMRGVACHELGHGTVFKTKWLNKFFLRLYAICSLWNFHDYSMSHSFHHLYTLHPPVDPEIILPRRPSLHILYVLQLFTVNIFGGEESNGFIPTVRKIVMTCFGRYEEEWLSELYEEHPTAKARAVRWMRLVLLIHVIVAVAAIVSGYWMIAVLFSCHIFIGNWLKYFVGFPMHCGLRDNVPDFRLCVRTIRLNPISEFLYWHMNWHTEHHMFAAVPCYNLSELHGIVKDDMPVPRSLVGAWREMRDIWLRQQNDPDYQFTTPLPPSANAAVTTESDELARADAVVASIGDLAPDELKSDSSRRSLDEVIKRHHRDGPAKVKTDQLTEQID